MTNEEILQKAIQKAIKNGYYLLDRLKEFNEFACIESFVCDPEYYGYSEFDIIFSHDFAKAFWGKKKIYDERRDVDYFNWEFNLEKMVLEEDPIKYLEKFL